MTTKAELLALLEQDAADIVSVTQKMQAGAYREYLVKYYDIAGLGKRQSGVLHLTTKNEGVVAGPQTYPETVLDEDGVTVLHQMGDPILDASGNQIVIADEDAEIAWTDKWVSTPKQDYDDGLAYMVGQVAAGTITGFEETKRRNDLGAVSFFECTVEKNNGDGTVTPQTWRVRRAPDNSLYHVVVV